MGSNRQMMGSTPIAEEPVKLPPPELPILAAVTTVYTITPLYAPEPLPTPQRYNPIPSTRTSPTPVKSTSRSVTHANDVPGHGLVPHAASSCPTNRAVIAAAICPEILSQTCLTLQWNHSTNSYAYAPPLCWVLYPQTTNHNHTQIILTS
ncbi:hypothetical protein K439DRAFT_879539 [Ramaria rubella]|nr:hypothetical protein K439DRAFT_879539 [Ramaria rubella]